MSTSSKITEGTIIEGRYTVVSKLGSGGFGTVYKARQLSTSQLVAIKVMHMSRMPTANSDIAAGRFEREMKLIAQLKHPNIVRLIDTGKTQQGAPFNVLELIEGQPLDTYIRDHGAFDARKAQHLMFQVLDALSAAHEAGVVHRDLKPSNIMVTTTGYRPNATVLDFGLSAVMEAARPADYVELTAQIDSNLGYAGGTPSYVAPEMLQKGLSSPQCDVYAWGLVFLECMTGSKIVDGPTEIAVLMRQGSDEPVPIPDDLPLSPILRAVITRAVAKPLDVRYTSATAVIRDHEDMASGAAPIPKLDLRASQRFAPSYADALPTDQMPFTRDDLAETVQEHPTDDAIRRSFGLVTEQNPAVPRPESVTAGPGRVQHGDIHQASTRDLPAIAPPLDPDDGGRLPLIGVLIVAACVGLAIWLGVRFIAQSSQQAKTPPIKAERIEESEADSTTPEEENKQTEPEAEPIACTTHSACSALSKTARCGPKHMCIEAVTERCSTVDGSLQDDDAILIGSIAKRLLEGDSGVAIQNGVALAVTEINNQGGLPGGRKLVHVGCNSEGTASGALEASRHLINNLNVHSIVGPGRSKAFLEVIPFAVRKGVMLISPSATSPVLTNLDDKGLGWRTAASDRQQAFAIADLLAQRKYTRIAALVYDDVYAQALLDNIRARFESNTGQKHAIIARIYTDPSSDKFNNTLSALIDKVPSPQAVLVLGHEEVADVIRAHHKASAGKLTHYMVSEGGRKTRTVALTQEFPKLSGLIEGVANIHQNGTLFEQFSNRYQTRFGTAPPTHAANAYDAVYLLTYATVAVGDQREPTGARLAKAMLSVVPDHCTQPECRIEVGPAHWAKAIERLTNDQNIDFEGASGKLDFDMKTGDITADVGLWTLTKANPKQFSRVGIYAKDKDNVLGWTFTR